MIEIDEDISFLEEYQTDVDGWNKFAADILGVRLDREQKKILRDIQHHPKVSIRSGNGRGKDYVACVAALCFLYLNCPSKVILTGPTYRQVVDILMAEIKTLHQNATVPLGGIVLNDRIKFEGDSTWYLVAFRAKDSADKSETEWSGYHSPHLMVIVTEASGVEQFVFNAIEGILTGDSREVLAYNPTRVLGEAYESSKPGSGYVHFHLDSFNAVNVRARKTLISGQVDWKWVDNKVHKRGWTMQISADEVRKDMFDFQWEGKWYRPSSLFLVKVFGHFPRESEDTLIPLIWIEMANERWIEWKKRKTKVGPLRLGVDVAGMGRDNTVFTFRRKSIVERFTEYVKQDHMVTVGKVKTELTEKEDVAMIDALGEGAGVYSRCKEQEIHCFGVKASFSAKGLLDATGARTFDNMRAYLYWCIRDALDPSLGGDLALPPVDELTQDLIEIHFTLKSNGNIIVEKKEIIKSRIGRSPDYGDSLSMTYFPEDFEPQYFRYISSEED